MSGAAIPFSTLLGMTLTSIEGKIGDDEIILRTSEGRTFKLFHVQDCCESVEVQDIVGDLNDLIGHPLQVALEVVSEKHPHGFVPRDYMDSFTWTFYKLATVKGWVDIRWLGESNGYYSESVDMCEIT